VAKRKSPDLVFESAEAVVVEMERRFDSPRLTVELLPATTWGSNLRSALRQTDWNRLRKSAYAAANNRCEVCGGVGGQYPVACHERWQFDDAACSQRLVGLIALCPDCHDVKHFGRANEQGRGPLATLHLCDVNGWSIARGQEYLTLAFALWKLRTKRTWEIDLSWLRPLNIRPRLASSPAMPGADA
jgi:hypothetical protein